MSNELISRPANSSTDRDSAERSTAFELALRQNAREVPVEGINVLDLLPGLPITQHTLEWAIVKFSIRFSTNYKQEVIRDQKLPNKVTELLDDAMALGWTDERFKQTVTSWLRSPQAEFANWTPAHVINHKIGENLLPWKSIDTGDRADRARIEGFLIGGYMLYRFADGRDLEREFGFERKQSADRGGPPVLEKKPEPIALPVGMPEDVRKQLEEFRNQSKLEE